MARSERRAVEVTKRTAPTPMPQPEPLTSPSQGPERRDEDTDDIHGHTRRWGTSQAGRPRCRRGRSFGGPVWVGVVGVLHRLLRGRSSKKPIRPSSRLIFGPFKNWSKVEGQIALEREPLAARQIELALVQTELWRRYTGDPDRLISAQDGLSAARSSGAPPDEPYLGGQPCRLGWGILSGQNVD